MGEHTTLTPCPNSYDCPKCEFGREYARDGIAFRDCENCCATGQICNCDAHCKPCREYSKQLHPAAGDMCEECIELYEQETP